MEYIEEGGKEEESPICFVGSNNNKEIRIREIALSSDLMWEIDR